MGKVVRRTLVTRPEQVRQLKGGPYGIVTGANLKRRPLKPTENDVDTASGSRQAGEGGTTDDTDEDA